MRWRQVIVLYLVLAGLAAEYWLVERRRPAPEPGRPARHRLLPVVLDDVREIRLRRGGRRVEVQRAGATWAVSEPPGAPVPPDLIAAFAEALVGAEEIETVGASDDARAYGLGDGAGDVELVTRAGERVRLTLGGTNPTGTAVYARRDGAPQIVLIGRNVGYYEELIFQALPAAHAPAAEESGPVGG